jgi:hypothetical protein
MRDISHMKMFGDDEYKKEKEISIVIYYRNSAIG